MPTDKHVYRNPDDPDAPLLGYRQFMRDNLPNSKEGVVVEDIDVVVRCYGPNYGNDANGKFFLAEMKFGRKWPGFAQLLTFGQIDGMLREADPMRERYLGFYIIQYDNNDWEQANFRINSQNVTREGMIEFLTHKNLPPPYVFPIKGTTVKRTPDSKMSMRELRREILLGRN